MPMLPPAMASSVISSLNGVNTVGGVNLMWQAICNYVQTNALVFYTWIAFSASVPPTPDPMVAITATINTAPGRVLSLPGINAVRDAASAMSILNAGINMAIASWMIQFPIGFLVSPCFVIPTVVLSPSGLNNQLGAMNLLCSQIIAGIKLATPAMGGSHLGIYNGAGVFTSIV